MRAGLLDRDELDDADEPTLVVDEQVATHVYAARHSTYLWRRTRTQVSKGGDAADAGMSKCHRPGYGKRIFPLSSRGPLRRSLTSTSSWPVLARQGPTALSRMPCGLRSATSVRTRIKACAPAIGACGRTARVIRNFASLAGTTRSAPLAMAVANVRLTPRMSLVQRMCRCGSRHWEARGKRRR
jgi:hypothetical protein